MKISAIVLLLLSCFHVNASIKIVEDSKSRLVLLSTENYVMSDNETRTEALRYATEKAKMAAAEKSGTLIYSQQEIRNERVLSEYQRIVSSSFMSVSLQSSHAEITPDNKVKLTAKIRAEVNKKDILKQLALLQKDKDKSDQIKALNKKNRELQKKLNQVTKLIQTQFRSDLKKDRDKILKNLASNNRIAKSILTLNGKSESKKSNTLLDQGYQDLRLILDHIKENTEIDINQTTIVPNSNGTSDIVISYDYEIKSPEAIVKILNKHFRNGDKRLNKFSLLAEDWDEYNKFVPINTLEIKEKLSMRMKGLTAFSEPLFKQLRKNKVSLSFSVFDDYYNTVVPIARPKLCFVSCSEISHPRKLKNRQVDADYHITLSSSNSEINRVSIKQIPNVLIDTTELKLNAEVISEQLEYE